LLFFFENPKHSFFLGEFFFGGTKVLTTETDRLLSLL